MRATPTYDQTPHDNYKQSSSHQEGSGGVKPWKISKEPTYESTMAQELGNFSKYFTIFLTSVWSSANLI